MANVFRFNQNQMFRWLVAGALIGGCLLVWPEPGQANGGTILLVKQIGAYDVTVTASPYPLETGLNDISVLLGRLSDFQLVLDAQVTLIAQPLDPPGEPQTFPATHDNATNKLYYAANVIFPTSGLWQLTVQVDGPEGVINTTFEEQVKEKSSLNLLSYVSWVALPLVILAVLFFVMNRRAEEAITGELEEEEGYD